MIHTVDYKDIVMNTNRANLARFYPLQETSGSTAYDFSKNNHNGSISGATLAQYRGPDGSPAIGFDGINDNIDCDSDAGTDFGQYSVGSIMIWWKVSGAGVWSDSTIRAMTQIAGSADDYVRLRKTATDDELQITGEFTNDNDSDLETDYADTDWHCTIVTWDVSGGTKELKVYHDNTLENTLSYTNDWDSGEPVDQLKIGSNRVGGGQYWSGALWCAGYWTSELTTAEIQVLNMRQ